MPATRYPTASRHFHWLSTALVILCYVLVLSRTLFDKGTPARMLVMQGHFWFGIAVLVLTVPRIIHAFRAGTPPIHPPLDRFSHILSKASHGMLYLYLIIQPVLGLLMAGFGPGKLAVPFIQIDIPLPFPRDQGLASTFRQAHILLGTLFYYVIGLHVVAVFYHHFIRKDNTLVRMSSSRSSDKDAQ